MQLLRRLESENARLEAALEWRRREQVFWQWMVRKPCHSPDHGGPGLVWGGLSIFQTGGSP